MQLGFSRVYFVGLQKWLGRFGLAVLGGGAIAAGIALPGAAVESITLEWGMMSKTVHLSDLETFAKTGAVPRRLAAYESWLTPSVRASLQNHLDVDPSVRDRVVENLLSTETGQPLVELLAKVVPDVAPADLLIAFQTAETSSEGVTTLSVLRSLPGETLRVKGGALVRVLAQLGLTQLEQATLSTVLRQELVGNSPLSLNSPFDPSLPGHRSVEHWSVSFRDHDRDRVIPIELYWTAHDPGPTVVLSHGFGADRHFLDYMAEHLASYGLTVVALEHPGSNVNALVYEEGDLLPPEEFVERPQDVSFILDRLEDLNRNSFFLQQRFDLRRVTLIGHSLGGYTGLVLAGGKMNPSKLASFCQHLEVGNSSPADWFQCSAAKADLPRKSLADDRITQLVLMNPLGGKVFGEDGLRAVKVPTLVVTSTRDGIASVSDQQLRSFSQLSGPRSLIAIIGGTHLSVGDPANINPALTQVPFMPEYPEADTLPLRQYLNGVVLSFVMQQTPEADRFKPYLTPEYAQLFSTAALPIRYSDRLPKSLDHWLANRDRWANRLSPSLNAAASLLHLKWIGAQYRLSQWRQDVATRLPRVTPQRSGRVSQSAR